jgi:hypothetical protein
MKACPTIEFSHKLDREREGGLVGLSFCRELHDDWNFTMIGATKKTRVIEMH